MGTLDPTEELNDTGDVYQAKSNTPVARVGYHLTVWEGWTAMSQTTGSLDVEPRLAGEWMRKGDPVTLHLADGRWIDLILMNTSGTVEAAGPLREER